ncbi:MAG: NUDIX hydrolase [Xanthobacteraceae bacterium]|nr:NUDIX hydrolase [Xanthobacteraceae bacterium]
MTPGNAAGLVYELSRLNLVYAPQPWPFAAERRAEIDVHFERAREKRPGIWNGQVLMMHRHRFERGVLEGAFLQTDFASFMAWRDWGFPETGVTNCFSMGALCASDGGWIMGVMAPQTSASGKIYFPAGTPDPDDVVDGGVDLASSVIREVAEETGLGIGDFVADDGWHCVIDGPRVALMKVLRARDTAEALRQRILRHLAREVAPELADVRIVRSRSDFDPMMPRFVTTFLDRINFLDSERS